MRNRARKPPISPSNQCNPIASWHRRPDTLSAHHESARLPNTHCRDLLRPLRAPRQVSERKICGTGRRGNRTANCFEDHRRRLPCRRGDARQHVRQVQALLRTELVAQVGLLFWTFPSHLLRLRKFGTQSILANAVPCAIPSRSRTADLRRGHHQRQLCADSHLCKVRPRLAQAGGERPFADLRDPCRDWLLCHEPLIRSRVSTD
jgi:hypothetical protein